MGGGRVIGLTQDQEMMLLALERPYQQHLSAERVTPTSSSEVGRRMTIKTRARMSHLDALSLARLSYDNFDAVRVGKQLARKGLVVEYGVKYGPKHYQLTALGRRRAAQVWRPETTA